MSHSLQPHGLQHTRPPCPSPTPGVYSHLCPLSQWCHPTISASVVPFSSHLKSFPASRYFQMSQLLASGGQSIGVSASTSVLPVNIQDWFPLGWSGWISLQSKGLSRIFSELKLTKMGEINSDDYSTYYCGQESLRRNRVALIVNKRIWNAVLGSSLKSDRMISVSKANHSLSQ